jgi:hypothetical protein
LYVLRDRPKKKAFQVTLRRVSPIEHEKGPGCEVFVDICRWF